MALYPLITLLVLLSSVPPNHDVFLSFRDKDTRGSFTEHLYTALIRAGIHTFKYDKGIRKGENMTLAMDRAINRSKISVIVFSKNYASSTRCLNELVAIMERRRTAGLFAIPIFYKVDPAEVEDQTKTYGEAFAKHKERFKEDMDRVERWRAALKEATSIAGMVLHDRSETQFIQSVVKEVENKLSFPLSNVLPSQNVPSYGNGSSFKLKGFLLFILLSAVFISRVSLFGTKDYAFVSIGGTDTEEFTSDLTAALIQSGIRTYRDHRGIRRGGNSVLDIRKAINISKISIVVFSKDYPSSKQCLDELLVIMERRRTDDGYIVVPIFYEVDPSEVKNQTGAYSRLFGRHAGIVKEWRAALKEAADQPRGVTLRNRYGQQRVQAIAKSIGKILKSNRNFLYFSWSRVSYVLEKLLNNTMVQFFAQAILGTARRSSLHR